MCGCEVVGWLGVDVGVGVGMGVFLWVYVWIYVCSSQAMLGWVMACGLQCKWVFRCLSLCVDVGVWECVRVLLWVYV